MTTDDRPTFEPEVVASRSVLAEVMTVLASDVDKIVVVGGWVPELLYPGKGHVGSTDVDLALDGRKLQPAAYDSIRQRLAAAGYESAAWDASIFYRKISDSNITVKLDLITGEGDEPREMKPRAQIQDMMVGKLRGTDVALDHAVELTITEKLPGGALNEIRVRIASVSAFLCMKAHALNERMKTKDAYDIHFCMRVCEGGPIALGASMRPLLGQPLVDEAIEILRSKFATIEHVGPQWAAQFASGQGEDFEITARDAFERMAQFLRSL